MHGQDPTLCGLSCWSHIIKIQKFPRKHLCLVLRHHIFISRWSVYFWFACEHVIEWMFTSQLTAGFNAPCQFYKIIARVDEYGCLTWGLPTYALISNTTFSKLVCYMLSTLYCSCLSVMFRGGRDGCVGVRTLTGNKLIAIATIK